MVVMHKLFYLVSACIVIAVVTAIGFSIYAWDYYEGAGPLPAQKTVIFKRGIGFQGTVEELAQQNAIGNPLLFKAIAVALGEARKFKAGEYSFSPSMTPHQIMTMIAQGKVVVHKVTVPEGWNVREVMQLLKNEPALEGDLPVAIKEVGSDRNLLHLSRGAP